MTNTASQTTILDSGERTEFESALCRLPQHTTVILISSYFVLINTPLLPILVL